MFLVAFFKLLNTEEHIKNIEENIRTKSKKIDIEKNQL